VGNDATGKSIARPEESPGDMSSRTSPRSKKKAPSRSKKKTPPRKRLVPEFESPMRMVSGMQNIVREKPGVRYEGGWKVSIQRRGTRTSKCFSDSKCGGKAKALAAAKAYRDAAVPAASNAAYERWLRENKYPPNSSGITGVARYVVPSGKKMVAVWDAFWGDIDGKRHRRRYYVSAHGERGAKARACATRLEAVKEFRREMKRRQQGTTRAK
jgi:hypothetical protein